jgi:hypothetical protein
MELEIIAIFLQILTLLAVCANTAINIVYRMKK